MALNENITIESVKRNVAFKSTKQNIFWYFFGGLVILIAFLALAVFIGKCSVSFKL